jgi:hypothetical protein
MRNLLILSFLLLTLPKAEALVYRSEAVKHAFDVSQGYPHGRKGYIVDHICALACGGKDIISNLQYQSRAEARTKDLWETTPEGCRLTCTPSNSTPIRQVFNRK